MRFECKFCITGVNSSRLVVLQLFVVLRRISRESTYYRQREILMFKRTENIKRSRLSLPRRRGGATGVVLFLLIIAAAIGGGVYWRVNSSKASKKLNLIYATAERGTFIHEVNGKGSAESAKNTDVASQVEGSATVIYLIPEGSDVKKGELLVELDSSDVDEKLDSQIVTTNSSRATLNSSRATLRSAEISLEEYVEGTFEESWKEYENSIFEAEQTRKQKSDTTRFTERLLGLDYATELQYEIDKVAEESAKNSLEVTNLKKMKLLKYTSEKQITSLMSDIETARAKVDSDKNSYNINLSRENRYRLHSANCKIRAPEDGQVVYANQDSRRMSESEMIKEGSTVRQRQVLIRLPDKTQMQVKTMINESNISSVKVGMPAKISFDSMPNRIVEGVVTKVNLYPEIVWMSSAKDYVTLVKINEDIPELRSGLTAQVRIIADEQQDVLMVPVQCVTEYGKKTYCITYNEGVWGCKEVLLGASNEKQVIILDGLKEGDVVVSGARLYRENVTFPDIDAPSDFEDSEIYQEQVAEREAEEAKQKEIETSSANFASGGLGNMPSGMPGGMSGGASSGMPGGMAGGVPGGMSALPEGVDLSKLAAMFGGAGRGGAGGFGGNSDDPEEIAKREEEAVEYAKSIQERLAHDVKIASIEPFFSRTVMEMQRELLSAISTKTTELQARIAARQNEITRRQEEIELLQKTSDSDNSDVVFSGFSKEDANEEISRLRDEIKTLRGDSEADPLERISYLEQIDWTKFVSGNDVTKEALDFLLEDSEQIFNKIFPNSQALDVSSNTPSADQFVKREVTESEETDFNLLKHEDDSQYGAFKPLFDLWDSNGDGKLKPTEFVIGFFTDRKSFQDSETDDDIDKLFEEYCVGDESNGANGVSFEVVQNVADKILRERAEVEKRPRRGSGMPRTPGTAGAPGMFGAPGEASGMPGRPGRGQGEMNRPEAVAQGQAEGVRLEDDSRGEDENREDSKGTSKGFDDLPEGAPNFEPPVMEPIKSLAEASSLRQAIAFFVMQMDFNSDALLQKSEFVKGYNEVKDVAGKLFASASLGSGDSGAGSGRMGPPPM